MTIRHASLPARRPFPVAGRSWLGVLPAVLTLLASGAVAVAVAVAVAEEEPSLSWERTHTPIGSVTAEGAWTAIDELGRVYTAGLRRVGSPTFATHIVLLRYTPGGTLDWERVLDDVDYEALDAERLADSGDLLVTGVAAAPAELVTHRLTADGDSVWTTHLPLPAAPILDVGPRISRRGDHCWVLTSAGTEGWLARYGLDGTADWNRSLADSAGKTYWPSDLAVAAGGVAYVVGLDFPNPGAVARTLAIDPGGTTLWEHFEEGDIGTFLDHPRVVAGPDSLPVAGGTAESFCGVGQKRVWKLDAAGDVLWVDAFPPAPCENATLEAMAVSPDGKVAATGWYSPLVNADFHTRLYAPDGTVLWTRILDGPGDQDIPDDVAFDVAGSVYVVGLTTHPPQNRDVLLAKWNAQGDLAWSADWAGAGGGNDFGRKLALGPAHEIAVAGEPPILTLLFSQDAATSTPPVADPGRGLRLSASPSPFGEHLTVSFDWPTGGDPGLDVLDVSGRRVRTLTATRAGGGAGHARWNGRTDGGRSVPGGVYFVHLWAGGRHETVRVVRVR